MKIPVCTYLHKWLMPALFLIPLQILADKPDMSIRLGGRYGRFSNIDDAAELLLEHNSGYPHFDIAFGFNHSPKDSSYIRDAWNYPTAGVGFSVSLYDCLECNKERNVSLSNIYNLYLFSEWDLYRSKKLSLGIYGEAGIGYTKEIYDAATNRGNWFLGSHLTLFAGIGPYLRYFITPQLELGLSPMFWHHSNGRVKLPNVGLNEYGVELFMRYHLGTPYRGRPVHFAKTDKASGHNWDIYAGAAPYMSRAQQHGMPETMGGTPEWRAVIGGDILWKISHIYSTGAQLDIFYTSDTDILKECDKLLLGDTSPDGYHPIQLGISSAHELYFSPRFTMYGSIGLYLYRELGLYESRTIVFEKLGARYYLPKAGNIFLALNCRAYNCVRADNLEFCIGKRF